MGCVSCCSSRQIWKIDDGLARMKKKIRQEDQGIKHKLVRYETCQCQVRTQKCYCQEKMKSGGKSVSGRCKFAH